MRELTAAFRRGWLMAGLAFLALIAMAPAARAESFVVRGVAVDVTAATADAAKKLALRQGERKAFDLLIRRMSRAEDTPRLPKPDDARITEMIEGFEVDSEKTSTVRYIAELSYRFRAADIRQLFQEAGVAIVETARRSVLVLPVYRAGQQLTLWDDPNPWRPIWVKVDGSGIAAVIAPKGEIADINDIDARQAQAAEKVALDKIARRYNATDILIATLATSAGTAIVSARKYDTVRQELVSLGTVRVADMSEPGMTAAARQVVAAYEESLKRDQPAPGNEQTVVATAPIAGFEHWIKLRGQLDAVQGIKGYRVLELGREAARLEIAFNGEFAYLQRAFQQVGLVLAKGDSDETWSIRLSETPPQANDKPETKPETKPEPKPEPPKSADPGAPIAPRRP